MNAFELVEDNAVMTTAQYFDLRINDLVKLVALIVANSVIINDDGRRCDRSDLGYVRVYRYMDLNRPCTRLEHVAPDGKIEQYLSYDVYADALEHILRVFW